MSVLKACHPGTGASGFENPVIFRHSIAKKRNIGV